MPSFDAAVRRYNNLVYCNHKITIFMTLLRLFASLGCTQTALAHPGIADLNNFQG